MGLSSRSRDIIRPEIANLKYNLEASCGRLEDLIYNPDATAGSLLAELNRMSAEIDVSILTVVRELDQ